MVLCKNILGFVEKKDEYDTESIINRNCEDNSIITYELHKGLEGFFRYKQPVYLTIYNLANISFIRKSEKYKMVLIVENPAVFMEISEKCQDKDFSDKIDVTSFVCEDTIELPRKILLKISGEKFIQFDYKTKEYEELRDAPKSISMNRERSV